MTSLDFQKFCFSCVPEGSTATKTLQKTWSTVHTIHGITTWENCILKLSVYYQLNRFLLPRPDEVWYFVKIETDTSSSMFICVFINLMYTVQCTLYRRYNNMGTSLLDRYFVLFCEYRSTQSVIYILNLWLSYLISIYTIHIMHLNPIWSFSLGPGLVFFNK